MGTKLIGVLFAILALTAASGSLAAQVLDEGFEAAATSTWPWAPWVNSGGTINTTTVHSGTYSLFDTSSSWLYRTDVTLGNAGDKYEAWAFAGSGRYYMGFAASAAGCYSLVLAPNTGNLIIQANASYGYADLVSSPVAWTAGWYRLEVEWTAPNAVVGRVFDSTGTTMITSVTYTNTSPLTGGVAMRSFGGQYLDDIKSITGPNLAVSATAGTALPVLSNAQGPGGIGVEAGTFDITSNNLPGATMTEIAITGSGTGDDSTAFTEISLYRDDPAGASPGAYDSADFTVAGPDVYTANDGTIVFTVATAEQAFGTSETRTYFVVAKLAGVALPPETFEFTVSDITVTTGVNKAVPPNSTMAGLVIDAAQFVVADNSPSLPVKAFLTFSEVCQVFTINYGAGPDDKPSSITVSSLGTADEATDLTSAQLWWDFDDNGTFNDTLDTQVDTQVFTQDNGIVVFNLTSHPDFQAGQTRRYFVIYELNSNADDLETFRCYISDMGAASLGGVPVGLPAPHSNGTPGLEVSAAIVFGIMNGPAAPVTVDSNSVGAFGDGELIADVTLKALPGGDWVVMTMIFNAGGTGSHNSAYSELALYEDDGSLTWSGSGSDTLAAPVLSGFEANVASFDLIDTNLFAGTERRFFLVGKLNGTAASGDTFNARLTDLVASPPPGGSLSGFPTPASTALIIDVPVISVANTPTQPVPMTHAGGTAGELVGASFRLNALNGATDVTGIVLTTAGTGDWTTDIDSASGVRVYRDDGDGVYSAANDAPLYQGGGAAVVTATFTSTLSLSVGDIADLWVVFGFTSAAGQGITTSPETFSVAIVATTDVSASAPVEFGMPAPTGITVGAIEFAVSNFNPPSAPTAGGTPLIIDGSGFMAPFTVTIGGTPCQGTPVLTGTQVTGLTVPAGAGVGLPIVIRSGTLPPQTLVVTFDYVPPKDNDTSNKSADSGCSTGSQSQWIWVIMAMTAGLVVVRRRRTA